MSSMSRIFLTNLFLKQIPKSYILQCRKYDRSVVPFLREMRNKKLQFGCAKVSNDHRNTYLEWNYSTELYAFGKRIGEEFEDALLRRALTEHSYIIKLEEDNKKVGLSSSTNVGIEALDNSLMESEGEAFLNDCVVRYLRRMLPKYPEEGIQSIKTSLLSTDTLSHIAFHLGLKELILSEEYPVGDITLSRVFKALVSALRDSSGPDRAALFVRDFVVTQLAETNVNDFWVIENPVEKLFTICRNEKVSQPEPRLVGQCAINSLLPLYRVGYYVDKKLIGLGPGENLKIAKEMAATDALWRLFGTAPHQLNLRFDHVIDPNTTSQPSTSIHEWCEEKIQQRLKVDV